MTTGTDTEERIRFSQSEVATPSVRSVARRAAFWIVAAVLVVLIAVVTLVTTTASQSAERLSATNPGANGAEALISVLRQDGVSVQTPRTLADATQDAAQDGSNTTLVLYDENSYLNGQALVSLPIVAKSLILIAPSAKQLRALAPGVTVVSAPAATVDAGCSFGPARRAGSVTDLTKSYGIDAVGSATGCFARGPSYALVRVNESQYTVTILGGTEPLTNEAIAKRGNAALALGLFGAKDHLIWYRPSIADLPPSTLDGVAPLPPWVYIALVLAGAVVVAAALWRGRRLGAIVIEQMPVFVRASETLEGRARLYQRASAREHALDSIRIATISRLASLCGLPSLATVDQVVAAVASRLQRDPAPLRALLIDDQPQNDRDLIRMSDELQDLEADLAKAMAPA